MPKIILSKVLGYIPAVSVSFGRIKKNTMKNEDKKNLPSIYDVEKLTEGCYALCSSGHALADPCVVLITRIVKNGDKLARLYYEYASIPSKYYHVIDMTLIQYDPWSKPTWSEESHDVYPKISRHETEA